MTHQANNKFNRLIKKAGSTFSVKVLGMAVGYLALFVVTKFYGAKVWGDFTLAISIMHVAGIISRMGLDTATIRFTSQYVSTQSFGKLRGFYQTNIVLMLLSSLLATAIVYLFAEPICQLVFDKPYLTPYIKRVAFCILPLNLMYLNAENFKGIKSVLLFAFFRFVAFHAVLLLFFLAYIQFSETITGIELLDSLLMGLSLMAVVSTIMWLGSLRKMPIEKTEKIEAKELLAVSMPMMITTSIVLIMGWTDTLMMGSMMDSTEDIGIYNVAIKLTTLVQLGLTAVNAVSTPKFSEYYTANKFDDLQEEVTNGTRLVFLVSFPMCLCYFIAPEFFMELLGEGFAYGAVALVILTVGRLVSATAGSVGFLMQMTGHEKTIRNIMLFAAVVNIVLNYTLIPLWGMNGAAAATSISTALWNIIAAVVIKKRLGITTFYIPFIMGKSR